MRDGSKAAILACSDRYFKHKPKYGKLSAPGFSTPELHRMQSSTGPQSEGARQNQRQKEYRHHGPPVGFDLLLADDPDAVEQAAQRHEDQQVNWAERTEGPVFVDEDRRECRQPEHAEIECNVHILQCLDWCIPDRETMLAQAGAWETQRIEASTLVD